MTLQTIALEGLMWRLPLWDESRHQQYSNFTSVVFAFICLRLPRGFLCVLGFGAATNDKPCRGLLC